MGSTGSRSGSSSAGSYLFVLASSREGGNTEWLARRAAEALPGTVHRKWIWLRRMQLSPFTDIRHAADGVYPRPTGDEGVLLDMTLEATDIVIASPLYWYSVSASAKLYLDYWAGWMRVPELSFKQSMKSKTLWTICALSEEDASKAANLVGMLQLCAEYFGMGWGGSLLGHANRPGEIVHDNTAITAATRLFVSPNQRPERAALGT